jgi:hypothetical protein
MGILYIMQLCNADGYGPSWAQWAIVLEMIAKYASDRRIVLQYREDNPKQSKGNWSLR